MVNDAATIDVPDDLRTAAREAGWPDGLLERALELRMNRALLRFFMTDPRVNAQIVEQVLRQRERIMLGSLRLREAGWQDGEALAELYANAPEEIGEWQVTVERSPYPFAQFRLQEHATVHVLEERGVMLATVAHSIRNTFVGGERVSVHVPSALRVHRDRRGSGYGGLVSYAEAPEWKWWANANYWYVRSGNFDAASWMQALQPSTAAAQPARDGDVPGLPVTVHYLAARPFDGARTGIRPAHRTDLPQCIELINRTHAGFDLFRPYCEEFLETRLDDSFWGPRPEWWPRVYTWDDYFVLEEGGRIVACAGLWDRGAHLREVWLSRDSGERRTIECGALMDFGCAEGREDALARLIEYLAGATQGLGRERLMAPLEQLPDVLGRLVALVAGSETRSLQWRMSEQSGALRELRPARPYTDLAYW